MVETKRHIFAEQQLGKETLFRRSEFTAIVLVADFGDDLAKAECQLSLNRVFQENHVIAPELITVNDVVPFNKIHAAFNLCCLTNTAAPKTVFVGVIDPGVGTDRKGIIVETAKEHYFIGPDNGIFYPAANSEGITGLWQIDNSKFSNPSVTFHGRDIFSKAAAKIASGLSPDSFGTNATDLVSLEFQEGQILHIDRYGNLKINGTLPVGATKIFLSNNLSIPLVRTFEDVDIGQPLAYLGSSGLLEIAIREGNASNVLGLKIGECLSIQPSM